MSVHTLPNATAPAPAAAGQASREVSLTEVLRTNPRIVGVAAGPMGDVLVGVGGSVFAGAVLAMASNREMDPGLAVVGGVGLLLALYGATLKAADHDAPRAMYLTEPPPRLVQQLRQARAQQLAPAPAGSST